jgi:hypothetical protein
MNSFNSLFNEGIDLANLYSGIRVIFAMRAYSPAIASKIPVKENSLPIKSGSAYISSSPRYVFAYISGSVFAKRARSCGWLQARL